MGWWSKFATGSESCEAVEYKGCGNLNFFISSFFGGRVKLETVIDL